jgi:hypothetical protein
MFDSARETVSIDRPVARAMSSIVAAILGSLALMWRSQ